MTNAAAEVVAIRGNDRALRARAGEVIPGGMYGHMLTNAQTMPASYPQFWLRGEGAYTWDVDDNRHIDFLCAFGPSRRHRVMYGETTRKNERGLD